MSDQQEMSAFGHGMALWRFLNDGPLGDFQLDAGGPRTRR